METASPSQVRAWARENGYEVSDRGRVPNAVQRAFDEAHAAPAEPAGTVLVDAASADPFAVPADPFAVPADDEAWNRVPPPVPPQLDQGRDGFSVAALVLGILPVLGGLLAVVFGVVSLRRIRGTQRSGRGMAITGIVLGSVWLAVFALLITVGVLAGPDRDENGAVTASGDVAAQDLRVDDCLAKEPLAATRTVEVVPCDQPHAVSVFAVFPISASAFPGEAAVKRLAEGGCERRLTEKFGAKAPQGYVYLLPTKSGWATGDHEVTCMVAPTAGAVAG